jgi:hypothetical protein
MSWRAPPRLKGSGLLRRHRLPSTSFQNRSETFLFLPKRASISFRKFQFSSRIPDLSGTCGASEGKNLPAGVVVAPSQSPPGRGTSSTPEGRGAAIDKGLRGTSAWTIARFLLIPANRNICNTNSAK